MEDSLTQPEPVRRPELVWASALAALACLVRLVQFDPAGVSHFDEGVYLLWAATGDYVAKEFYAPPLFPWLTSQLDFAGDPALAARWLNSLVTAATVPLVWWIARRWYGPVAGCCAAPLAAFSGMHITFARMALIDVLFTLLFVAALWLASEALFLSRAESRPRVRWPVLLAAALAAGAAMNTKYNGILLPAIATVSVLLAFGLELFRKQATPDRPAHVPSGAAYATQLAHWNPTLATLALFVLIAAVLYVPWFWHVHSRYGYGALWAHHRGYAEGLAAWPGNLMTLVGYERTLARQAGFVGPIVGLLGALMAVRQTNWRAVCILGAVLAGGGWLLGDAFGWTIGAAAVVGFAYLGKQGDVRSASSGRPEILMHLVWLGALITLTPLYRPYARLLLPLDAAGWIATAALVAAVIERQGDRRRPDWSVRWPYSLGVVVLGAAVSLAVHSTSHRGSLKGVTSLESACRAVGDVLPAESRVAAMVRPPVLYHLRYAPLELVDSGSRQALDSLLESPDRYRWLLVDGALVRDNAELSRWLESVGDRIRERIRVSYRPAVSVYLDDFGSGVVAGEDAARSAAPYELVLYRVEPVR